MPVIDAIKAKLEDALSPSKIEVLDESAQHAGHSGAQPGGETHFAVSLVSEKFRGISRVQRHKMVYEILKYELANGVHALRINTVTPEESR